MKGYLVGKAGVSSINKNTMRIYTDLEDVIENRLQRLIEVIGGGNLYSLNFVSDSWGYRVYEFEIGKDKKPIRITNSIVSHFVLGDIIQTCIIPRGI